MKKMHLLCNAHLDPAWLWRWNEGLAESISTFRVAADFCEQYDCFVFNHNEALLYEWVEEHEPALFERIKALVQQGKWKIVGGWYLQPDCVLTSGESLLEQISLGREYFRKKFGVEPKTAINFDPFGHSRGLVQILAKTGFTGYIFMRPQRFRGNFIWEGFDGSRVLAHGIYGGYNTLKGEALDKIKSQLNKDPNPIALCTWGVGNHGGGPSRKDLEDINAFIEGSEVEILHSDADTYMADVDVSQLPVRSESLIAAMVGCYTSMVRIKQANRRLESKLALTQKAIRYAELLQGVEFDENALTQAKKALAFCQFHDILPGSGIKPVEEDGLRTMGYAEEIADKLCTKAFIKLCAGQPRAADGEIPVMVFNPHPYPVEGDFKVEFMLQNQNWNDGEHTYAQVWDCEGNPLPTQNEKPHCTFNLDWIQRISFHATLAPACISRFNCTLTVKHESELPAKQYDPEMLTVENDRMKVWISRKTGLIARYEVDGKLLLENDGVLEVYNDNEDPWGMNVNAFTDGLGSFALLSDVQANAMTGYPQERIPNVRVIEDGDVRMKLQAFFGYGASNAIVEYAIPKQGAYLDVDIRTVFQEPNRMLKYALKPCFTGTPWGETAFGCEALYDDEREAVYHRWCGIRGDDRQLYVLNRGTYGGSFTGSSMKLSLQRTPIYAAHPIRERTIAPHDRWTDHIDMGERRFSFRITADADVAAQAQVFNEAPVLMSLFPDGTGESKGSFITVDDPQVLLSSVKKNSQGYQLTLFNSADRPVTTVVHLPWQKRSIALSLGKYELKFLDI